MRKRSLFGARFDTAPKGRNILGARTVSDAPGIDHPQVVAPKDLNRSMLYVRVIQPDRFKMPPRRRNIVDADAAQIIAAWIKAPHPQAR
jgi:hypothetical protein